MSFIPQKSMSFVFAVNSLRAVAKTFTCFAWLSQKPSSGAIGGINRNVLNCYLIMLIVVSIQGKTKRPRAIEQRILSRESVSVFLFVLPPAVSLGNSLPLIRPGFPLSEWRAWTQWFLCCFRSSYWHKTLLILRSRLTWNVRQLIEWKQQGFFPFSLGFYRICEIIKLFSGVWAWEGNVVWLSHVWVQLDQGGMHQPRKNGCAVLGQGLNLSLSYFGGKFTSDCIQSLLSVNYEPKYRIEVMAQRGQNTRIMHHILFLTRKLSIFPLPPNEHLWSYNFNHPSAHQGSTVFKKILEKKSESILFFMFPRWVVPHHGNEVRMVNRQLFCVSPSREMEVKDTFLLLNRSLPDVL